MAEQPHALRWIGGPGAVLVAILATVGGVGWLYLLRHAGVLNVGPRLSESLPLQRLARGDAQPVLRLIVAWVPAGAVAGLAAVGLTALRRPARAILAGVVSWVILFLASGLSDAVTASDPLTSHLGTQPGRAALWVAALLFAVGAALAGQRLPRLPGIGRSRRSEPGALPEAARP